MAVDKIDQSFIDRCRAVYQQCLPQLMADHQGKVIAIEPESGEYFLGETLDSASEQAQARRGTLDNSSALIREERERKEPRALPD